MEAHAEPIPGYKLLERLGEGGFGEVWKAEAPGGLHKAVKIVHGSLRGADEDEVRTRQELKALNRVKAIRHPFILSLERFDIVDGRLVIVTELADRNLWDRFKECRNQGLPGIPRDELLNYLDEAAEALDLMNVQHQLQHLDIKPQNLFLVYNHVKVADFGLVKDLEGMRAEVTSGITALYAPPETFEGVITPFCDQYSLAIVYMELLTGHRPYNGTNARQLMMQHLTAAPDLEALSAADRPIVARGLSKKPEDRYPSCTDLVRALRQVTVPEGPATAVTSRSHSNIFLTTPVALGHTASVRRSGRVSTPPPEAQKETTGDGVLRPALVIGVGRLGLAVLHALKRCLRERVGGLDALPNVRLLYIDADPQAVRKATQGGPEAALHSGEVVLARLNRPSQYLRPAQDRPPVDAWLDTKILCKLPRERAATEGMRALGRLAFVDNYRVIADRLRAELRGCSSPQALAAADRQTRRGTRTNQPCAFVVAGLGGGSGSGAFLDLAYTLRHLLRQEGWPRPRVEGILFAPALERHGPGKPAHANAYAALRELHHFSQPDTTFSAYYGSGATVNDPDPPFTRTAVLPFADDAREEAAALAGDYLARELTTRLGVTLETLRTQLSPVDAPSCDAFGLYCLSTPRRSLVRQTALALRELILRLWLAPESSERLEAARDYLEEQRERRGLTVVGLEARLSEAAARHFGQPLAAAGDAVMQRLTAAGPDGLAQNPTAVLGALGQLELVVGAPVDVGVPPSQLAGALDRVLAAVAAEWEQKFGDLVMGVLDQPGLRLAAAEAALRQLYDELEKLAAARETELAALTKLTATHYHHLTELAGGLQRGALWWIGRSKAKAAAELIETARNYLAARSRLLVQRRMQALAERALAARPRYQREMAFCREQLQKFAANLPVPPPRPPYRGVGRELFPDGAANLGEAIDRLLAEVTPDQLVELDVAAQKRIARQLKSVGQVCTAPVNRFEELAMILLQEAEEFVQEQLGPTDVVDLYLREQCDGEPGQDMVLAFDEAVPEVGGRTPSRADLWDEPRELAVVVSPDSRTGERFRELAGEALPERGLVGVADGDDVVLYRERTGIRLADLPQAGSTARAAYERALAEAPFTPHARTDVVEWTPLG